MGAIYSLDTDGEWHRPERPSLTGGRFMVGCTTTSLRGGNAAAQQTALESAVGFQSIRNCYAGASNYKASPYWLATFLGAVDVNTGTSKSIRTTHVSWDPDCELLVSENPSGFDPTGLKAYLAAGRTGSGLSGYGTETTANLTWLLSCPVYAQCIWTPWHEADGNVGNAGYDWTSVAHFKLGLQIICDMVHAFANPLWSTCLVLDAYVWKAASGSSLDPVNFWPGSGYIDIMGVDSYNEGSVLSGTPRWDSFQVGVGYPADSAEGTAYQTAYGVSGTTAGMKHTDSSGLTWSNGFLGWCEAMGITKWLVRETGTQRNITGLSPTWVGGGAGNKEQWIESMATFVNGYNIDGTHNAKCVGLSYFMRGRPYAASTVYATAVHLLADGSHQSCVGANTFASLPTSGNTTGDKRYTTDTAHVYQWSGSAWTDLGAAAIESWELWWNEDGSGWDSNTCANSTWADVNTVHNIRPTS